MASSYLPSLFSAIPRLYSAMATVCLVSRPLLMSAVQARTARSGSWTLAQLARGSSQPATAQHISSEVNAVRLRIYHRFDADLAQIIRYSGTERHGLLCLWRRAAKHPRQPFCAGGHVHAANSPARYSAPHRRLSFLLQA